MTRRKRQSFRFGPETHAIEIMNALRDRALADHQTREGRPLVDSKAVAAASLASIKAPENRT